MRSRLLLLALALAVLSVATWMIFRSPNADDLNSGKAAAPSTAPAVDLGAATAQNPSGGIQRAVTAKNELSRKIEDAWREMVADAIRAKALLAALEQQLNQLSPEEAARVIRDFLNGRKNADTRLGFSVGDGGSLAAAPTLRVWLLDQLGRRNPEAAADYAQQILATRESADEWAVAMRNFARVRATPADAEFLKTKARELLGEPRWQQEQSTGWLEAFDVVVHTHATELAPELSKLLVRKEDAARPAAHAAFLTLDRLVLAEPAMMLETLVSTPDLMRGRELTRANYFARADVSDVRQREIVERYLLDTSRSPEELSKFAGLYPNANLMISKNLITPTTTPSRGELVVRDREALRVTEEWLNDARFSTIKPHITAIHARLSEFVRQAEK